jgi:hypothetical protein
VLWAGHPQEDGGSLRDQPGPNRKTQKAIRTFGTMTDDLLALAEHPDLALPTHRDAVALKAWVRSRFGELTDELARTTPVDARGRAA